MVALVQGLLRQNFSTARLAMIAVGLANLTEAFPQSSQVLLTAVK
jgi:hypothetical protein